MDCKKVQELILTDYIDRQLGEKQVCLLEGHLAYCSVCQRFFEGVKKGAVGPFVNVPMATPDAVLWSRIKQAVEEEQQGQLEKSLAPGFGNAGDAVHIPRPAFALATILTMIFMIGPTSELFINTQSVKVNGQEQIEYLSSLIDEPADVSANNGNDTQSITTE